MKFSKKFLYLLYVKLKHFTMGTNFYLRRIPTVDDVEKLNKLIADKAFEAIRDYTTDMTAWIHIGKRSCGWQFMFNHHNEKYFNPRSKQSLMSWLQNPGYEIIDEYGAKLSFDEFWNMVTEWNADPYNSYDDEAYYLHEQKESGINHYMFESDGSTKSEIRIRYGVTPKYHDFVLDGIRYSTHIEFC